MDIVMQAQRERWNLIKRHQVNCNASMCEQRRYAHAIIKEIQ